MQVCCKLGDKLTEIFLAFLGDFFKIDNEPYAVVLREILNSLLREILACRAALEHRSHFVGEPVSAVGIVQQRHCRDFDGRVLLLQRLQPCRQLRVGLHIQAAGDRDGVQPFGNEQVDFAEMLLKRRQRCRVPAHIKRGAHGIIGRGDLAQRFNSA